MCASIRSVILDFDSTLVPVESLEELLLMDRDDPQLRRELDAITRAGMGGELPFRASLEQRLALAQPTRQQAQRLGDTLATQLTVGTEAACAAWRDAGIALWIVSGGLREVLLPSGARLGIPPERVQGVRLLWDANGGFTGVDPDDPFATSKVDGLRSLARTPKRPSLGIGDGVTDRALFVAGLTDGFIAFTEHERRASVVAHGDPEATDFGALRKLVETWPHDRL